ncbi:ion transporter [Oceanobacillus sp. CFH 90083]|uniref:ion transporter n=1 Tax=Oceanobacillus sp. CFH 90083 TaxID=2592336 RepID=UPI00128B12F1|nr:ion transporter [Oceanobacillus sp. CFH 90083]
MTLKAFQNKCAAIAENKTFTNIIIGLILLNAIIVGLETYPVINQRYTDYLYWADVVLLSIFTIEIIIRIIGSSSLVHFFKNPWNIFDFVIVTASILFVGSNYVIVLRIFRILRVLRAISIIPSLRKMVNALLLTIPSMGNIMILLAIFFYMYAVIGTMLFQSIAPDHFGSLHRTLLTLFQILTLDSWATGVMYPILEETRIALIYFLSFILIGAFVIVNLFVGVIVNNVEEANRENQPTPTDLKLEAMENELKEIKALLKERDTK